MKINDKIIFSKHAIFQIQERNLSELEIISTISYPDKIILQSQQKFQAIKLINQNHKKYLIIVVYRQKNSFKKVITAFLTTKIEKYLLR